MPALRIIQVTTFTVAQSAGGYYDVMVGPDPTTGGVVSGFLGGDQQTLGGNRKPVQVSSTKITISGVALANGKPLQNIQVVATVSSSNSRATTTSPTGTYSLQVPQGSSPKMSATFLGPYTIPITADGPANGSFPNVQTNQVQNFSAAKFTTVYLLHGIGQGHAAMFGLWQNLAGVRAAFSALDTSKFLVDSSFDYSECTTAPSNCGSSCTISAGAQKLAKMLAASPFNGTSPGWDVVLVGYSIGGLIARDLLVNGIGPMGADRPRG